jgi:hypothetical protein
VNRGFFIWLTSSEIRCRFAAMAAVLRIERWRFGSEVVVVLRLGLHRLEQLPTDC